MLLLFFLIVNIKPKTPLYIALLDLQLSPSFSNSSIVGILQFPLNMKYVVAKGPLGPYKQRQVECLRPILL